MPPELNIHLSKCDNCHMPFQLIGDDWWEVNRMHDDRIGTGTMRFGSKECAMAWLARQPVIREDH